MGWGVNPSSSSPSPAGAAPAAHGGRRGGRAPAPACSPAAPSPPAPPPPARPPAAPAAAPSPRWHVSGCRRQGQGWCHPPRGHLPIPEHCPVLSNLLHPHPRCPPPWTPHARHHPPRTAPTLSVVTPNVPSVPQHPPLRCCPIPSVSCLKHYLD